MREFYRSLIFVIMVLLCLYVVIIQPTVGSENLAMRIIGTPIYSKENIPRQYFLQDYDFYYDKNNEYYFFLRKIPINSTVLQKNGDIFLLFKNNGTLLKFRIVERVKNGYIIATDLNKSELIRACPNMFTEIPLEYKIDKNLKYLLNFDKDRILILKILLFRKPSAETIRILSKFGYILKINKNTILLKTTTDRVKDIAKINQVRFICNCYNFIPTLVESSRLISSDIVLESGFKVKNVTVGVVDSGIVLHPHFHGVDIYYAWDWVDNDKVPIDENKNCFDYGHGTHVAGIISGSGKYNDTNITGISPNAPLLMARVFGPDANGDGLSDWYYDVDCSGEELWKFMLDPDRDGNLFEKNSADVICNSWGADRCYGVYDEWSYEVDSVIFGKYAKRPVIVFSAGNAGKDKKVSPPGTSKNAITVGACYDTASEDEIKVLDFSQRGTQDGRIKPDILAPGAFITSAVPLDRNSKGYETWEGTSMATPFVAALAAQIKEKYPEATPELIKAMIIAGTFGGGTTDSPNINEAWGRISSYQTIFKTKDEIVDVYDFGTIGNDRTIYPREVKYELDIPEGTIAIVATLVYSDDPGPIGSGMLQNDLDLFIVTPDGNTIINGNWDTRDDDSINNVEKYILRYPKPGRYEFHVKALKLNDLGGRIPKFVNYAIIIRVIKPTQQPDITVNISEGNYSLWVKPVGLSIYNCLVTIVTKDNKNITISIGDIPLGKHKKVMLNNTGEVGINGVYISYFDVLGNKYLKTIDSSSLLTKHEQHYSDDHNNSSDLLKSTEFVKRNLPPNPDPRMNFTVTLHISGITIGAVKEYIPYNFDLLYVYSSDPKNISIQIIKNDEHAILLVSWYGEVKWIKYILKASCKKEDINRTKFHGTYINIHRGFDVKAIEGDTTFRQRNTYNIKQYILSIIIDYIYIENIRPILKDEILDYIIMYMEHIRHS